MFLQLSTAFCVLFVVLTGAIQQSTSRTGCSLIDKTRPPQFIFYEKKTDSEIQLRLRNNTSCAIVVETDEVYPTRLRKLPQGGVRIEHLGDSQDGVRLRIHYLIHNRKQGDQKRAYGWGDSVFTYE